MCFRPLAGIMVLINFNQHNVYMTQYRFRPLAGIMVLILDGKAGETKVGSKCFRPLAGIMVLITKGR